MRVRAVRAVREGVRVVLKEQIYLSYSLLPFEPIDIMSTFIYYIANISASIIRNTTYIYKNI